MQLEQESACLAGVTCCDAQLMCHVCSLSSCLKICFSECVVNADAEESNFPQVRSSVQLPLLRLVTEKVLFLQNFCLLQLSSSEDLLLFRPRSAPMWFYLWLRIISHRKLTQWIFWECQKFLASFFCPR